jgi:hypothetical protein
MIGRHLTVAEQWVWEVFPQVETVTMGHSPAGLRRTWRFDQERSPGD